MSSSVQVFVGDVPFSLVEFVGGIEPIIGLKFQYIPDEQNDGYYDRYEFVGESIGVYVSEALDFDSDENLDFERYQHYIGVMARNLPNWQKRESVRDNFARFIYEKLKATQHYRLMLVYDLQVKLDEFSPESQERADTIPKRVSI